MASNYTVPDVYLEDVVNVSYSPVNTSASIGAMIGATRSGVLNTPTLVTSWTDFVNKFANGLDTAFLENSYLPYSVYGFFVNGGQQLYVTSIKGKSAVKAKTSEDDFLVATAKSEGAWGNDLSITVSVSKGFTEGDKTYDFKIDLGTSDTTTITEVTKDTFVEKFTENTKVKYWFEEIGLATAETEIKVGSIKLTGGADGEELTDEDYTTALETFDNYTTSIAMLAIPGQSSKAMNDSICSYCEKNGIFPIIDAPMSSTPEEVKLLRRQLSYWTGALAYPYGKVKDNLTNTIKTVPSAGHIMGVYARTIEEKGIQKAPAGVDATVRGFIGLETEISATDLGVLNSAGVVCIVNRPDSGIVVWGARSLNSSDRKMKYVTDGLLNLKIKRDLYLSTQYAIFESNDADLWSRLYSTCYSYLKGLFTGGALKGASESEAFFITVDSSNNTQDTIDEGFTYVDIGYAPKKPSEFIVIRLAHSME